MSCGRVIFAALFFQFTGCSLLIMRTGTDISDFENQKEVRSRLGTPDTQGRDEDGSFDVYRTRWKVAEPFRAASMGEGWAMTFGLVEFVTFPVEVYTFARRTIVGQELRFSYNSAGQVVGRTLDGDGLGIVTLPLTDKEKPAEVGENK